MLSNQLVSSRIRRPLLFTGIMTLVFLNQPIRAQPFHHSETYFVAPGSEPREHAIDIKSMKLEVSFEPMAGKVKGRVTHVFRTLRATVDTLYFDGVGLTVHQVTLSGKPVRFAVGDSGIRLFPVRPLTWDSVDSVMFVYDATPIKGIYFVGWNDSTNRGRKQIWTQGQAVDHRHWIPMYDEMNDKMTTETVITFDTSYTVISNGDLLGTVTNSDATKTWQYQLKHPHAGYLLMIAIGDYNLKRMRSTSGIPMEGYYYSDKPEQAEPTYRYTVQAMDFLEAETGYPYPWGVYRQVPVQDFIYGAMENTTATIFGDFFQTDARGWLDRSYVNVNVHELVHQWFGNLITARSSKSLWLQESFATFYPMIFERRYLGEDTYQWSRWRMQQSALEASKKDLLPIVHTQAGSSRIYSKGAVVLDMMNYVFGEDQFRRVVKTFLTKHAFGNVETSDLYNAFQDTLGLSPERFFKQWLYRGGEPHFRVKYWTGTTNGSYDTTPSAVPGYPTGAHSGPLTYVLVQQIHHVDALTDYFQTPVDIHVYYKDGKKDSVRHTVDGATTLVMVPNKNNKAIDFVVFDPGSRILKNLTFDRSEAELTSQVRRAVNMVDRYEALLALGKLSHPDSSSGGRLPLLKDILRKERFRSLKEEAIRQLSKSNTEQAIEIITQAFSDKDVEVRRAALTAYPILPPAHIAPALTLLADSSYSIVESSIRRIVEADPRQIESIISRTQNTQGANERVRIARLEAMVFCDTPGANAALDSLADLSGTSFEFLTRQNAISALTRLNHYPDKAIKNIIYGATSFNGRLSGFARNTIISACKQSVLRIRFLKAIDVLPSALRIASKLDEISQ